MEGPPAITRKTTIPVFEGARDTAASGERVLLETYGLNGSTAVAVGCEHQDGTRSIQLTHYPPFMIDRQLAAIARLTDPQDTKAPLVHAVVHGHERLLNHVQTIENHLRTVYGPGITIDRSTYGADGSSDGSFRVASGSESGQPLERIG